MFLEVRKQGNKKFYYLASSIRSGKKVKKVRVYIGLNLSEKEIADNRIAAEKTLQERINILTRVSDPLKTMLSDEEKKLVESLIGKEKIELKHLSEDEWLRFTKIFTYNTNAIEGSTVTISEVKNILAENKWPSKKSRQEIAESIGVAEAVKHIRTTKEHLSIDLIKELHRIVFRNSLEYAGEFRRKGVEVAVVDGRGNIIHRGAPPSEINRLLKEMISWYAENQKTYHPIVLAGVIHNQFENIHPFQDGNGRVGRLLLNNTLLKNKMPPVNIELINRQEYYQTLQTYENQQNLKPTITLIIKEYKKLKKQLENK